MIRRLKRLLETERKNLRQVRSQYAAELQNRTELEIFLHQCIEDVKHDIARRRSQLLAGGACSGLRGTPLLCIARRSPLGVCAAATAMALRSGKATFPPVAGAAKPDDLGLSSFTAADRERVMELLLSQERVISLLCVPVACLALPYADAEDTRTHIRVPASVVLPCRRYSKTFPPRSSSAAASNDGGGGGMGGAVGDEDVGSTSALLAKASFTSSGDVHGMGDDGGAAPQTDAD